MPNEEFAILTAAHVILVYDETNTKIEFSERTAYFGKWNVNGIETFSSKVEFFEN